MKQLSYWKKFAKSGNVFDYLKYKAAEEHKNLYLSQEVREGTYSPHSNQQRGI